ncbi:hypothetical protein K470DRAFT_255835 [Piedraia hortae CBS 480.64]|uniref:Uncharacterized protein n=1 Tax=Piedraia hortae CBS 480.64 TaxID=1314780 RepID=A0A6A7C530_9PEZI|nr:hypothetical protein K470DRAFT_255835 [Piedraia hortae CBS 480.64]
MPSVNNMDQSSNGEWRISPDIDKEQLLQALSAQTLATRLLEKASHLKDLALKATDPEERQKIIQEAYDKEVEAHGHSKLAQRLQSGVWQGGIAGAGIGGSIAVGLGATVGTLVGGVTSVPTAALGGLIGAGVGGINGPFVKLDQKKEETPVENGVDSESSRKEG